MVWRRASSFGAKSRHLILREEDRGGGRHVAGAEDFQGRSLEAAGLEEKGKGFEGLCAGFHSLVNFLTVLWIFRVLGRWL